MGSSSLSQTVTSSYNNVNNVNNSTSTINFGPNDHAYSELHEELYYDEKEQQKKNARSALNNVASFLPPAVSQSLTKVVQQAQAVVGTNPSKMSLPTTFGTSSSSPSVTSLDPSSVRGMLLKLYKASKLPLLCLAWYLSSAVTNNIGKQIMNQFRYPVTLTFIQFLFVSLFCFLSGTMGLTKIRSPTVGIMQMTAPLVGFQVVGHVFSSVAISRVPLSVVHTIKVKEERLGDTHAHTHTYAHQREMSTIVLEVEEGGEEDQEKKNEERQGERDACKENKDKDKDKEESHEK